MASNMCTCKHCGKEFYVTCCKQYAYVRIVDGKKLYFCSYSCLKRYDETSPKTKKRNIVVSGYPNKK